jgi:hypothetical protein
LDSGYAAWVEGIDDTGRGLLKVLDTRTHKVRVFSRGHPGGALLIYRGSLDWGESKRPGALTSLMSKSLESGRSMPPPSALEGVKGASSYATDGTAIAWVGSDQRSLYYAANGSAKPKVIVRFKVGGFNPPTVVHGSVVLSTYSEGVLAAGSNGASTTLVHGGGSVTEDGDGFLVGDVPQSKGHAASTKLAYVPASAFAFHACP